jgi:hypothetical protein
MSYSPSKRSVHASAEKPGGEFNWPPTDEELAQYGIKAPASRVPYADPVDLDERPAQSPAHAQSDRTLNDAGPTQLGAEEPSTSLAAVAKNETVLDGASPGEWTAEIARLQGLIEGLTQKLA